MPSQAVLQRILDPCSPCILSRCLHRNSCTHMHACLRCAMCCARVLSGIMQSMVTAPSSPHLSVSPSLGSHRRCVRRIACDLWVTHNNKCAEMLAVVRRGPFARPTAEERIEYLLTRVHKSSCGVAFAQHALEHTLSFQRRVQAIKLDFLRRCTPTPLGVCHDFWDRTEAQQRGALHSHILVWFRKRRTHPNWVALRPVERVVKGDGPKQRRLDSAGSGLPPLPQGRVQHDTCYQMFDMGRVSGEMVRPTVTPGDWGGYDVEMLRIGSLARTVLVRLKYLHVCSPVYCLKDSLLPYLTHARMLAFALRCACFSGASRL